jgi:hypothetical protein
VVVTSGIKPPLKVYLAAESPRLFNKFGKIFQLKDILQYHLTSRALFGETDMT